MENKKRKLKKGIIAKIIIFVCTIGVIYSTYNIVSWKKNVDNNNKISNKIAKYIKNKDDKYEINFKKLKNHNSDTIAYLKVNNTKIDYVVVKGEDNSYYLNHNFNKEANTAGWIFADYRNKFDGSDRNIIIYGHNTRDGSMFGSLKNVLETDWQTNKKNQKITFVAEEGTSIYQVFSTYTIEAEEYYITTDFKSDNQYSKFINKIQKRSIYNYGIKVNNNNQILTLSTCNEDGKKRVVLHAKKI